MKTQTPKTSKFNELEKQYKLAQEQRKAKIKAEPNKFKRLCKWCWYLAIFPFVWLWTNIRDWHTAVIFIIVFLVVSIEVWLPLSLAFVFGVETTIGKSMIGVASACWSFWLLPGTPFIVICIGLTIGVKALFNKIKMRKSKDNE